MTHVAEGMYPVTVLCQEHRYNIEVNENWTITLLKHRLQTTVLAELSQGKTMRVIYGGRVLSIDSQTLEQAGIRENAVLHVALTDRPATHSFIPHVARFTPATNISSNNTSSEDAAPGSDPNGARSGRQDASGGGEEEPAEPSHRMGFDRLLAVGLTPDDVAVLRSTYLEDVRREMMNEVPLEAGETESHRLLRMEDEWMRRQDAFSEFAMNLRPILLARLQPRLVPGSAADRQLARLIAREHGEELSDDERGTYASAQANQGSMIQLIFGVILGAMFGFFMLLWTIFPNVSRRFKSGILMGVFINIIVQLWTLQSETTRRASGGGSNIIPSPNGNLRGYFYGNGDWPSDIVPVPDT